MPTVAFDKTSMAEHAFLPHLVLKKATIYNDFRDELRDNGFVVIKGAIPKHRAVGYQRAAFDWLQSFNTELDVNDPDTWVAKNFPVLNPINGFSAYSVSHEKFMWDARMEPGVLDAFNNLWQTDELLVSFDVLNVTFPNRKDSPARKPWEHVDQCPSKRGMHCVQGIINLSPCGPEDGGLVVYPKSHKYHDEFYDSHPDIVVPSNWEDIYLFSPAELDWFKEKGIRPHKVCADPGDLILWDSRTIHYGSDPIEKANVIRTVIYATYMPAKLASEGQLELKKRMFEEFRSTTHWPYEHLEQKHSQAYLQDGSPDPRDRMKPRILPDMSDKLLKLAGVRIY